MSEIGIGIGIIEGFYGPEWSHEDRFLVCDFLASHGADFYLYAPKRDPHLRKEWKSSHDSKTWEHLQELSKHCHLKKIKFGVGLSPFELFLEWGNEESKEVLKEKVLKLKSLKLDLLGLFFDDMKASAGLAAQQISITKFIQKIIDVPVIFCPTYYCYDPLLDRVFGPKPEGYLEAIGEGMPPEVFICWTGNKVISEVITGDDLKSVAAVLKRKPFIWDNFYANDGPRQCKFIRLKPLEGRTAQSYAASSGWAFNLMNQAHLSMVTFLNSLRQLKRADGGANFKEDLEVLCDPVLSEFILKHQELFHKQGLDKIDPEIKNDLCQQLARMHRPVAREISDWLEGKYLVGPECLTD